jgi:hypothetical protein
MEVERRRGYYLMAVLLRTRKTGEGSQVMGPVPTLKHKESQGLRERRTVAAVEKHSVVFQSYDR